MHLLSLYIFFIEFDSVAENANADQVDSGFMNISWARGSAASCVS